MKYNSLSSEFQKFIHLSKYSRWDYDKKRRETWNETVERYITFFIEHLKERCNYDLTTSEIDQIRNGILNLQVMPSMRCLMTAGPALKRDEMSGYNCSYIAINRVRAFDELFFALECGCFSPDTNVKTRSGVKKIKDITEKDFVITYNMESGVYDYVHPSCISAVHQSSAQPKLELEFEDGSKIRCTEEHEFLTKNRGWVKAKDLTEEDDIMNHNEIL